MVSGKPKSMPRKEAMTISSLNAMLRKATEASREPIKNGAGTNPLDEVQLDDLYTDSLESSATTSFVTIIDGPGLSTIGAACAETVSCASLEADDVVPVRFETS